jgi:hypothetical protein
MCCNKVKPAVISATLAAGSIASPYFFLVNITQILCASTCAETPAVFNPRFSLVGYAKVGTNQYVATIHVEGIISYIPCGGNCDCTRQQPLSQNFTVPFYFSGTPLTVSIAQGATANSIAVGACQSCSKVLASDTSVTLTVSATATAAAEGTNANA